MLNQKRLFFIYCCVAVKRFAVQFHFVNAKTFTMRTTEILERLSLVVHVTRTDGRISNFEVQSVESALL